MAKRKHNYSPSKRFVAGTMGALSVFALTTQTNNIVEAKAKQSNSSTEQHSSMSSSASALHSDGQLSLAPITSSSSSKAKSDGTYVVKRGDTLSELAEHFNVTVDNLVAWNNIPNPDLIYVGQRLSIDGKNINSAVSQPVAPSTSVQQNNVSGSVAQPQAFVPGTQANVNNVVRSVRQEVQSNSQQPVEASNQPSEAVQSAVATSDQTASQSVATTSSNVAAATNNNGESSQAPQPVVSSANSQQATSSVAQATTNSASSAQVTSSTSATPQSQQASTQSQTTAPQQVTPNQQSTDLQSGSVVSLASKIATANKTPYVWGGNSLNGMDCSGFVDYVYANAEGKQLPHNSAAIESYVNKKPVNQAQAGDLLFWGNQGESYHVGIYLGNNQYAAAAKPGTNVATYNLSNYFYPSFAGTVK